MRHVRASGSAPRYEPPMAKRPNDLVDVVVPLGGAQAEDAVVSVTRDLAPQLTRFVIGPELEPSIPGEHRDAHPLRVER